MGEAQNVAVLVGIVAFNAKFAHCLAAHTLLELVQDKPLFALDANLG
jgi:hypothetical protein